MIEKTKKGFTGFYIKFMALLFMLLDHIHYFFEFTGKVPVLFSWIGRLAGGLFLFTMIEGYTHTSNRKKYFIRIYFVAVLMGFIKYLIPFVPSLQRGDGFYPQNGIFATFVILIIMFKGIDYIRDKKILKGILLTLSPFILNYIIMFIFKLCIIPFLPMETTNILVIIVSTFIPSPFLVEGGLFVIIGGIILFIFHKNRKVQCISFALFTLIWMIGLPLLYIKPISLELFFTHYYEWMGALSIIFMLLYNGEKGKSMKKLFYIFYPAHIYILYILSVILYHFKY